MYPHLMFQSLSSLIPIGSDVWLVYLCQPEWLLVYNIDIYWYKFNYRVPDHIFYTLLPEPRCFYYKDQRSKCLLPNLAPPWSLTLVHFGQQLNTIWSLAWPGSASSKIPETWNSSFFWNFKFEVLENFFEQIKSWKVDNWQWHRFCQMHAFKVRTGWWWFQTERCQFCDVSKTATSSPTGSCCLTKFPKLQLLIPVPPSMNGERSRFVNLFD